jgi:hypothetical protein
MASITPKARILNRQGAMDAKIYQAQEAPGVPDATVPWGALENSALTSILGGPRWRLGG